MGTEAKVIVVAVAAGVVLFFFDLNWVDLLNIGIEAAMANRFLAFFLAAVVFLVMTRDFTGDGTMTGVVISLARLVIIGLVVGAAVFTAGDMFFSFFAIAPVVSYHG